MPSEISIAKQLSGTECLEAICAALRNTLAKDDRFYGHIAYSGFKASVELKFHPYQSFVPDVERTIEVQEGDLTGEQGEEVKASVEMPVQAPNKVREEAGLPLPVLVTDEKGNSHEKWKKVGKQPTQLKVPTNRIIGGN